ncbi:MAG: O-antigen ligase family protein [Caulobacterales bacterium]
MFTLGALIALMSPARLAALGHDILRAKIPMVLFALLWLWLAASYFWTSQDNPKTLIGILVYLPLLSIFAWSAGGVTQADRDMIVRAGIACVLILAILAGQEGIFKFPFYTAERGPVKNGAELIAVRHTLGGAGAALAVLLWPAVAALDKRGGRAHFILLIPIALAIVISRYSHTSSIILAVIVGSFCYIAARAFPRIMIVLSGLAIIEFLLAAPRLANLLKYIPDSVERLLPVSYKMRLEIWQNTAAMIAQKPLLGWGVDASKTFKQAHVYADVGARDIIPWHPHNVALHLWLEIGLVGVALVAALVLVLTLSLVRGLSHDHKATAGAVGGLGAFCVFAGVSFGAWQAWFLSSGFAAAALIIALVKKREGGRDAS